MTYKYYRVKNNDDKHEDKTPLSSKLKSITGYHCNDYIKPVIKEAGEICTIIADESEFKGHFSSGLVILPYLNKKILSDKESKLEKLIDKYALNDIHFTNIFGRKKILTDKRDSFLKEYSAIVNDVPMSCLSISKSKHVLLHEMKVETITNEDMFFSLFWNNFERIIASFPNYSIFHIYMEQEYRIAPQNYNTVALKLFNKLYSGIDQIYALFPDKYISICKHPHFFTKKALLYSSLADFLAYSSNKLQNKIDLGISDAKIINEYGDLLRLFKVIFKNYTGLPSRKIVKLINNS